uniref:NADH-ubiquinone oxidoreductase chain 4 n=1 Tax=Anastatus dexingensis TaxID=2926466 RepID=A0A9E9BQK0_9HYME|nr:NADH dehydrogenase subunit 4 [Anastatus dexingensis]WAJ57473.1 NADH dehydrogenase subunit 4 [Anastatus dexingensis]
MMKVMFMMIFMYLYMMIFKSKKLNIMLFFLMGFFLIMMLFNLSMGMDCWMNFYGVMGMDNFSIFLLFLSIMIVKYMIFIGEKKNVLIFFFLMFILLMFLMICFFSMNYFLFYLFFEMSLIPTFFLIMGWGKQPERLMASMYMYLYTLFFSLPLLVLIYMIFDENLSLNYLFLLNKNLIVNNLNNKVMYFFLMFAFLVKLPMFMFHMWLPKAHVEAPITGSMILAGVMLKLGGYGLIRSMMMMMKVSVKLNFLYFSFSILGMMILSIYCLCLSDLKLLVAYSSVVHMGIMLMGLLTMSIYGFIGGMFMMIGHGFCSSALFILVNYFYERSKTRSMMINKGLMNYFPSMMFWWFSFCMINMSAPISLNLISELFILMTLLNWSFNIFLFLMLNLFLSACYSIYLFINSYHGKFNDLMNIFMVNKFNEFLLMIFHWIPLNFLLLKLDLFF